MRQFYTGFDSTVETVKKVLADNGWAVKNSVDPSIYERDERWDNDKTNRVLILPRRAVKTGYSIALMRI